MACVREPCENDRSAPFLTIFYFILFFHLFYLFYLKIHMTRIQDYHRKNECGEETEKETLSLINIGLRQNIERILHGGEM